jgi:uncharacterized protein YdaU (DUF1376 family)
MEMFSLDFFYSRDEDDDDGKEVGNEEQLPQEEEQQHQGQTSIATTHQGQTSIAHQGQTSMTTPINRKKKPSAESAEKVAAALTPGDLLKKGLSALAGRAE